MLTTLCYLEKDNKYLMLHRNKKEIDINKGKWLGVGGKLENGETPDHVQGCFTNGFTVEAHSTCSNKFCSKCAGGC